MSGRTAGWSGSRARRWMTGSARIATEVSRRWSRVRGTLCRARRRGCWRWRSRSSASSRRAPRRRCIRSCSRRACRAPGLRTLQTHLARAGLNVRADGRSPDKVYGRFEAQARNELWTGDGLHGPKLAGAVRRTVLLAFIDDHSRLLVGWRWGSGEDVIRLEAALRPGLMARGVPEAILVDFVARHKIDILFPNRLCARLLPRPGHHGGRPLGGVDFGHITVRARRASSACRRSARLGCCGIPRKYLFSLKSLRTAPTGCSAIHRTQRSADALAKQRQLLLADGTQRLPHRPIELVANELGQSHPRVLLIRMPQSTRNTSNSPRAKIQQTSWLAAGQRSPGG